MAMSTMLHQELNPPSQPQQDPMAGMAAQLAALQQEVEQLKAKLAQDATGDAVDPAAFNLDRLIPALEAAAAQGVPELPATDKSGKTVKVPTDPETLARFKAAMGQPQTPEALGMPPSGPEEALPPMGPSAPAPGLMGPGMSGPPATPANAPKGKGPMPPAGAPKIAMPLGQ